MYLKTQGIRNFWTILAAPGLRASAKLPQFDVLRRRFLSLVTLMDGLGKLTALVFGGFDGATSSILETRAFDENEQTVAQANLKISDDPGDKDSAS